MEEKRSTEAFDKPEPAAAVVHPAAAAQIGIPSSKVESIQQKLWRGKWLLLCSGVAFSLIALMLGALQTPLYRAQTSIEIQATNRIPRISKVEDLDSGTPSTESYIQTQIRIIESRSLIERVLSEMSDAERTRILEPARFWKRTSYDQSVDSIRLHLSVRPADQAGIVDISFLSPDAATSAHFLNLLTQKLEEFNLERAWRSAQHNRQWADRQVEDLGRKWEQSEQLLAEYTQASRHRQVNAVPDPAEAVNESSDSKLRELRNKLDALNKQAAAWEALYGPSGAAVLKLKAQAGETEAAIRRERSSLRRRSSTALSQSGAFIGDPTESFQPKPDQAHLRALQHEAEANRTIYETAAARLKEASIATSSQVGDVSVVDPAIPPTTSTAPSQFLTGALGALTGLLVGVAFIVLRERFSNTFSEPAFLGHYLGLQLLGAVPINRFSMHEGAYSRVPAEQSLHVNFEIDAQSAEAFRSIRASILLGTNQRAGARRLVFTSATASEGKTFVVANLGAALASAQRRVLLVDADLRNPGLHRIFGAENGFGLADLLTPQLSDNPITSRDVIRETEIPDLYLLSAGQAGSRAPEILSSAQLPNLIREFAKGFDLVLLDSSPVLPYSDARSVARAADAIILVVKAGSTDRHAAMQARDCIGQDGTPILGTILTEWDVAQSAFS